MSSPAAPPVDPGDPWFDAVVARALPDPAIVIDAAVEVVWCNPAAERLFGLTIEDVRGRSGLEFIHPDDLEMAALSLTSVAGKEVGSLVELRVRNTSGWRLVEVRGTPLGDTTLLCLRDLTDRRRWELAGDETAKFRSLLHNAAAITMLLDEAGTIVATSAALTRLTGIDQESAEGRLLSRLVVHEDRQRVREAVERAVAAGGGTASRLQVEARIQTREDGPVPFALSIVNLLDDPTVEGLVVSAHDISDRVQVEEALHEANSVLAATLEATAEGILVVDRSGRIVSHNARFAEMWDIPAELLERRDDDLLIAHVLDQLVDPVAFEARVRELYARPEMAGHDVLHFVNGRVFERDCRPQRIDGQVVGHVWNFRDVSQEYRLREELTRQAFTDSLTGLANQALFRDRAEHAVARIRRQGGRLAVMFIDLDDFKNVNDSLGHGSGDALLATIGPRLRDVLRPSDTVARLGGDEFAVLLEDVSDDIEVRATAERLIGEVTRPVSVAGTTLNCSASVGVAFGEPGCVLDDLLRNADLAMYHAKSRGKGCHQVYEEGMHAAAVARLETEANLRRAVRDHELVVWYQPVWELETGAIEAVEALVRWQHPDKGLLGPGEFIPFAEERGLIDLIGEYVLATACRQMAAWADELGIDRLPRVSVNVSPRQLLDRHLPRRVRAALERNGLPPDRLILEVTEGALMRDPETAQGSLQALRDIGIHLAVDDFGTGYSSLVYLQRFPIDFLKIDKAFVDDVATRPDETLVGAILQLATTLGLVPIAEGIEEPEQVVALSALGCGLGQGFLLARPADATRTLELLREHRVSGPTPATIPARAT